MFDEYDKNRLIQVYNQLVNIDGYYTGMHNASKSRLETIIKKLEELASLESIKLQ